MYDIRIEIHCQQAKFTINCKEKRIKPKYSKGFFEYNLKYVSILKELYY